MSLTVVVSESQKAKIFTGIFQHMKHFCDHINIIFRSDSVYAQGMDNSHISIFELFLPASWFDAYSHPDSGDITLGFNVGLLFKILNTRDEGQEILIKHNLNNPDKLFLHFITSDNAKSRTLFDKHFELPLLEIEHELMSIPETEYTAEFTVLSANFSSIVNQLKQFGADLYVLCNEDEIRLTAKSNESGNMSVVLPIDDLSLFAINEGAQLQLSFSLAHLANICSFHKSSDEINVRVSEDFPLKATYFLEKPPEDDESETSKARIVIYLAPRISDDNDA